MRKPSLCPLGVLILMALGAVPTAADADPFNVIITSGFGETEMNPQGGPLSISGTEGFSISGGSLKIGSVQPGSRGTGFDPGSVVPVGGTWCCSDISGTLTLAGFTFPNISSQAYLGGQELFFTADLVTLPLIGTMALLQSPFMVSGFVRTPPLASSSSRRIFLEPESQH